jgi:hypothetical protein
MGVLANFANVIDERVLDFKIQEVFGFFGNGGKLMDF